MTQKRKRPNEGAINGFESVISTDKANENHLETETKR